MPDEVEGEKYEIYRGEYRTREGLIEDPPKNVELTVRVPEDRCTCEEISGHLRDEFHLEIECDPDSAHYLDLFHNQDLRSLSGSAVDWRCGEADLVVLPRYFSELEDAGGERYWKKLVEASEIREFGELL
jgi:hypothetical protein